MAKVTTGIGSQYPFLATARRDVDWRHVSPVLLRQLNALGRELGQVIVLFSGYRSDAYSQRVGGFAGDPHTRHIAVDATINGKPIGKVVSKSLFVKYGLRSGNVPGFYQGKPDPSHVDLVGTANAKAAEQLGGSPAAAPSAAPSGPQAPALPDYSGQIPLAGASSGPPDLLLPGTVQAGGFSPRLIQQTWQLIASQPNASPDTISYAGQATG